MRKKITGKFSLLLAMVMLVASVTWTATVAESAIPLPPTIPKTITIDLVNGNKMNPKPGANGGWYYDIKLTVLDEFGNPCPNKAITLKITRQNGQTHTVYPNTGNDGVAWYGNPSGNIQVGFYFNEPTTLKASWQTISYNPDGTISGYWAEATRVVNLKDIIIATERPYDDFLR